MAKSFSRRIASSTTQSRSTKTGNITMEIIPRGRDRTFDDSNWDQIEGGTFPHNNNIKAEYKSRVKLEREHKL